MSSRTILVWFRNDLRVHDNEILTRALERGNRVVPVYCFDPRHFVKTTAGIVKTGINRAEFIRQNVFKLREKLRSLGSNLICSYGTPEEILPELCKKYQIDEVYHHREVAFEETQTSNQVEAALWKLQINLRHYIGHTLYHKEDLPFPIKDIPDAFQSFRKKAERESLVRPAIDSPLYVESPLLETEEVPDLHVLGFSDEQIRTLKTNNFEGGEDFALLQMCNYLDNPCNSQKDSKLAPYIALGVLSPIRFYHEIQCRPLVMSDKKWADHLITGLLKRDYFRFMFKKYGNRFFKEEGFSEDKSLKNRFTTESADEDSIFEKWSGAKTGDAIIDKGMRKLNEFGYISDPMRTILAAYWINVLGGNWLKGAAWFEEKLLDYAPASNYGNWAHMAGIGTSAKDNKPINLEKLRSKVCP